MRRTLLVLALFVAVAAFVASGCGGDDSTTGAATGSETGSAETTTGTGGGSESGDTTESGDETSEAGETTEAGGGTTDDGGSLTKVEYVKQGNEACAEIQKKMGEEFEAFVNEDNLRKRTPSHAESQEIIGRFAIPAMKEQIAALRALPAPSGDEEQVKLIIARQEESLKKMEKEPLFRTSGGPYEELNKPASDYGLTECSV